MESWEPAFSLANAVALLGWALLVGSPRSGATRVLVHAGALPLLLSLAYLCILATQGDAFRDGGFGSLAQVSRLFAHPGALLAGWVHYLAFDLWVGAWITREGFRLGLGRGALLPLQALTFLFGPVGMLAFAIVRGVKGRSALFPIEEQR